MPDVETVRIDDVGYAKAERVAKTDGEAKIAAKQIEVAGVKKARE